MNDLLKTYNVIVKDFEDFFNDNAQELYSKLIDYNLHNDFELKNKDTKKIIHNFLIKKSLELLKCQEYNYIIYIKPEIFNIDNEIFNTFNSKKIRIEVLKFVKFIKTKFQYNFYLMKKSHAISLDKDQLPPDVMDYVNIFLFYGSKNIFNSKLLSKELYKTYEKSLL